MFCCGLYLALVGLAFLLSGSLYMTHPADLVALAGIQLTGPASVVEVRAYYGGVQLAVGLFMLASVLRPALRESAVLLSTILFLGMALGRVSGVVLGGQFDTYHLVCLGMETGAALLGTWMLVKSERCVGCPRTNTGEH